MERFNLKKRNGMEVKEWYQVKISEWVWSFEKLGGGGRRRRWW
jgi:hypothetical protein